MAAATPAPAPAPAPDAAARAAAQALAQAVGLANAGQTPAALALCEAALAQQPQHPGLRQLQATLLLATGQPAAALAALSPVLQAHPGHAPAQRLAGQAAYEHGRQLQAAGDAAAARTAFEAACRHQPALPPAWSALALVCEDVGDLDAAAHAWHRLLALTPDDATAWLNLGLVEQARGRLHEALRCHGQAWRLQPGLLGRIAMALCSQRCGAVYADEAALRAALALSAPA